MKARIFAAALGLWLSMAAASQALDLGEARLDLPDGWQPGAAVTDRSADFTGPGGATLSIRWWRADQPLTGFGTGQRFTPRSFPAGTALVLTSGAGDPPRMAVAFDHRNASGEMLLVTIEGQDVVTLESLLLPVADAVRFDTADAALPAAAPAAAALSAPGPSVQALSGPAPAGDLSALLSQRFGGDCVPVPLANDPLAGALTGATPEGRASCPGQGVELVIATLPQDPRGASSGLLQMLYLRAFMAGEGRVVAVADPVHEDLVLLRPGGAAGFSAEIIDLPQPVEPLFAGRPSEAWDFHLASGGLADWARYEDGVFIADVPPGPGYRTTGLRTIAPVIRLPGAGDDFTTRIRVDLDTPRLNDVVIAVVKPGDPGRRDWDDHEIWLGVEQHPGKTAELLLAVQKQIQERVPLTDPAALAGLVLEMRPDGLIRLSNETGVLAEGRMAAIPTPGPYHLQISATAPAGDVAAYLALRQVQVEELPADPAATPDALLGDAGREVVLFDGLGPGAHMDRHGPRQIDPAAMRFGDEGLIVDADAAALQGIGLYSVEPVVWLDRFGPGASVRLRLDFDPARTSGVELALAAPMSYADNEPGQPGVRLHWRTLGDGHFLTRTVDRNVPRNSVVPGMPEQVDVVLTPDGVQLLAEGFPDDILPWPLLRGGTGLRLFVTARGDHESQPAKMGLRRITLMRTPGAEAPSASPAPGVEPLPQATLLPASDWEGFGLAGVDFTAVGSIAPDGTVAVDVPQGHEWGRAGVLSGQPVAILDHRLERTGYGLAYQFDPAATDGFEVILSQTRTADMADGSEVILQLVRQPEGRTAGDWLLHAYGSYYRYWTRRIPAVAMAEWDGRFEVQLSAGTGRATIPGIAEVLAPDLVTIRPGISLFTTVHSRSALRYGPAKMTLREVRGGWITPPGMTERARLVLLGPEGFDPAVWVARLREELEEPFR